MSSKYKNPKCDIGYNLVKSKCKCKKIEKRIKKSNKCSEEKEIICENKAKICNPFTGRCVNNYKTPKKTVKNKKKTIKKTQKKSTNNKCPDSKIEECSKKYKICNPKTGRCIKLKLGKTCKHGVAIEHVMCINCELEKKRKEKQKTQRKKKTVKCRTEKNKLCKKQGKECNPKTGRCIKVKKPKLKKTKKKIKKSKRNKTQKNTKSNSKEFIDGKCSMKKVEECDKQGKVCNPKTGRCNKIKRQKPNKKIKNVHLSPVQKELVKQKRNKKNMKSYSPEANKELVSIKMHSKSADRNYWLYRRMENLYNCKDKIKININGKCVDYKNKNAQKTMLELLEYRDPKAIKVDYVIGPAQVLSNCWLNSFFMCYFISDKGRKFFRHFRRVMITGEKKTGGTKIQDKYRKGLWLLNKIIQASLFNFYSSTDNKYDAENFIRHVDTNDVIRLLRGKGKNENKAIVKPKKAYNPTQFYTNLFDILGLEKDGIGVNLMEVTKKSIFKELLGKTKMRRLSKTSKPELILIERRDDGEKEDIDSKKDKVPKKFKFNGNTYVLDSVVLRSINQKHFTSYVTIGNYGYAFEGGAHRRLRPMFWKDILTSGKNITWDFGSPLDSKNLSRVKDGYLLSEKFNFKKGYQILFYYRI